MWLMTFPCVRRTSKTVSPCISIFMKFKGHQLHFLVIGQSFARKYFLVHLASCRIHHLSWCHYTWKFPIWYLDSDHCLHDILYAASSFHQRPIMKFIVIFIAILFIVKIIWTLQAWVSRSTCYFKLWIWPTSLSTFGVRLHTLWRGMIGERESHTTNRID